MGTSPLLLGDEAARAWAAIDETAAALAALPREALAGEPTLAGGAAGMAMLFAYLAGAQEGRGHEDVASRFLEWAQEDVAAGRIPFGAGFYQGFTGVAWVAEHITGEPQDAIDEPMEQYLQRSPWPEDYDLISGLAGYGVWALEALPRPGAAACLRLVCERLCEWAQPPAAGGPGLTWWTPARLLPTHQRDVFAGGYENYGVAHGFPAVIAVLAQAVASGVLGPELEARALATARGGVGRMLSVVRTDGYSRYPTTIDDKIGPAESRLAWCYGDAGVAGALLVAAQALGEPAWRAEAETTALLSARRTDETAGVADVGLCHGSAGLAVLFARFHEAFGHQELHAAARHWAQATLAMRRPEGFAGWAAYGLDGYKPSREWLTGATGVALALLSAVTGVLPDWDRVLLASPCPAALRR